MEGLYAAPPPPATLGNAAKILMVRGDVFNLENRP